MSKASILVIARNHIPEQLLKHGFNPATESMVKVMLENPQLFFMDRDLAENDPNFKQLIPMWCFKAQKVFSTIKGEKPVRKPGYDFFALLELEDTSKKKMAT